MLNRIWLSFFWIAFLACLYQWLVADQPDSFSLFIDATYEMSKLGVEVALGLVGVLCLWLGFFRVAEQAGLIASLSKVLSPVFRRLMPDVPNGHPATGSVSMNMGANLLGLDNAATPMGLKAMKDLQLLNPQKDLASNPQILFLVLNTSSVTLLPVTVFLYRAQQGAAEPAAVFIPILLATSVSTFVGLFAVSRLQGIRLFDWKGSLALTLIAVFFAAFIGLLASLPSDSLASYSAQMGNLILASVILLFLTAGFLRKVDVYSAFITGAKQGFGVAVRLIPFLVAMLVAIGVLRASGALDGLLWLIEKLFASLGVNTDFVAALPTAFMKPLSGSGSRAMMLETMNTYGVDSFPALLAATIQGSTETTFYVLAVYFGSVGIKKIRYALWCGLLADFSGIVAAILLGYWFFY